MSDGMLSVIQDRDPLIQTGQQFTDGKILYTDICQNLGIRQHFPEQEATPQSGINCGNRTVSGIHGADDVNILGNTERFLRIG